MANVLIDKASKLKPETRAAVEAELGRALKDDEDVSILAFPRRDAPTGDAYREASRQLKDHLANTDARTKPPEAETEAALDEALRNARPRYRERR